MHSYSFDNDTEQLDPDMLDVVSPENKFLGKIALTGKETIWEAWLKTLLCEDEALIEYTISGNFICKYGIIPANQNVENLQNNCLKPHAGILGNSIAEMKASPIRKNI